MLRPGNTMAGNSKFSARSTKLLVPAWVLSVAIHAAMLIALGVAMKSGPRGTGDAQYGSMGLVIHRSSPSDSLQFDPGDGGQSAVHQASFVEELSAPLLLVAAPAETPQPEAPKATTEGTKPAASTSKAQPKQSKPKGSGRPTAASGSRASGSGSGYGETSVFGVQGKGTKFIYVFDRSASMEGRPLAAAKRQLLQSLQSLDSVNQFHIIFFNTKTQAFDMTGGGHRIAFASDRNKKLAGNFVGGITADGGTDRMFALKEALGFAPDVIFFLTDADDAMSAGEMAELARINQKVQASICVIEFGKNPAPVPNNFLSRLAHDNGGQYGYVDTTKLK
jgi:hypothetical protein